MRRSIRGLGAVLGCLALLTAGPAVASAAQRFAGAAGAGTACTSANPCSLAQAVSGAASGDEVLVAPGAYAAGTMTIPQGVDVHGPVGGPAPVVTAAPSAAITVQGRLADLAVRASTQFAVKLSGLGERLDVRASGANTAMTLDRGAILRDSVVVTAGGNGAIAWYSYNGRFDLRNVTAINTGVGYALYMNGPPGPPGSQALGVVRNTIARGGTGDLAKVGPTNQTLRVSSSAFRPAASTGVTDEGGNVAAEPLFFDTAGGDYHQLGSSATVNAGAGDPANGLLDIDGQSRTAGPAIDIGADEYPGIPPSPPAPPSGNLLANPGADAGAGAGNALTQTAVPGWTTTPTLTAVRYGASGGFPGTTEGRRIGGGPNFFAGGPANSSSTARQTVSVAGRAAEIDAGVATARLAADLGGWFTNPDAAAVTATFRSASNAALGTLAIGPVSPADRGGDTVLLRRAASARVPARTRTIEVVITATNAGTVLSYNDGYADNLSLTLAVPPAHTRPGRDRTAPRLRRVTLAPAAARAGATTSLRFSLSETARVRVLVQRGRRGVLRRRRCVAPRRGLRGRRCTRWATIRTIIRRGRTGRNTVRLTLRSGRRALAPGSYRVVVSARDPAGNASRPVAVRLTIRRASGRR